MKTLKVMVVVACERLMKKLEKYRPSQSPCKGGASVLFR